MTLLPGNTALLLSPLRSTAARDWQRAYDPDPAAEFVAGAVASALARVPEGSAAVLDSLWETARGLGAVSCTWADEASGRVLAGRGLRSEGLPEGSTRSGGECALSVPVMVDGRQGGTLHLVGARPGGFGASGAALLASLAGVLGHACSVQRAEADPGLDACVVDGLAGPALVLESCGKLRRLNPAAQRLVGLEAAEAVGRPWGEVLGRVAFEADLGCVLAGGEPLAQTEGVRIAVTDVEGRRLVYLWRVWRGAAQPGGDEITVLHGGDVTTQARLEQEIRSADRLVMAGQLATGLAHELRNPLSAIQGFGEYLQQQVGDGAGGEHLNLLVTQARRAEGIVRQLLGFAAPVDARRQPVDLNELVRGTLSLLSYQLRRARVEIGLALQDDLPAVAGNATEIQQVLVNLLVNAQHALAGIAGARVTITTGVTGDQVQVAVVDNGPGIAPSVLGRVFQPFVSTKPEGMGTGLGLSICAGIIEQHRGAIAARNRPEGGAEFIVRLPLGADEAGLGRSAAAPDTETQRALVVDDDEAIRTLLRAVLSDAGLDVQEAHDGHAALAQLRTHAPHVVVCDVNMPGMSGRELYETLLDDSPEMARRMVFTTGSVAGDALCDFAHECGNPVLAKPFALRDLLAAVDGVLQR